MIHIIHISDSHQHFEGAIREYIKRLGKNIHLHTIRPTKHTDKNFIKNSETEKILEKITKIPGKIFLCDETGKSVDTYFFSKEIQKSNLHSENMIFVIGGSYGMNSELFSKNRREIIQFSEMVFPHSLALLILLEQIYRAREIIKGSKYHHE